MEIKSKFQQTDEKPVKLFSKRFKLFVVSQQRIPGKNWRLEIQLSALLSQLMALV